MNVQEVADYVKRQFGDESGVQLTDADIFRWINAAQRDIVMQNESVLQTVSTIDLVANQDEYAFPVDLLILRSLRAKSTEMVSYQYIEHRNLTEFDKFIAGWDGTFQGASFPSIYTVYERTIFLFPIPSAASTAGLKLLYSRRPIAVDALADSLDLPEEYHNAIVQYCLAQANIMDEDLEAKTVHQADYISSVRSLSFQNQQGARETYPVITVLPDDAW